MASKWCGELTGHTLLSLLLPANWPWELVEENETETYHDGSPITVYRAPLCAHNDLNGIGILDTPWESRDLRHHYHHLFNDPNSENRTLAWWPSHAYFEFLSGFGGTDYSLDNGCGYLVYDSTPCSGAWDTVPIMSSKSDNMHMLTVLQELILAGR